MAFDAEKPLWESKVFRQWPITHGAIAELYNGGFAFQLAGWNHGTLEFFDQATHFGYVLTGQATLEGESGRFDVQSGMYFCQPGGGSIRGKGSGIVVSQYNYRGLFHLGGPIESSGRLQYMDGCSDTLLIPPVVLGDGCLNLLHLPPHTNQTAHTHPSFRCGVIVSGYGQCLVDQSELPLESGNIFVIEEDGLHSFRTQNEALLVIAFHPDSDFGPRNDDHPMVNRTIIDGVSASKRSPTSRRTEQTSP